MIPALQTIDLARLLGQQRQAGTGVASTSIGGFEVELVHVAPGERWESLGRPDERMAIVMEGLGTITVDDWRATLGPGLAALVPPRRKLAAAADGTTALALMLVAPTPPMPVADEPAAAGDASPSETSGE
ncbi:MAG: cupin domain-containing protein [Myxococcota bacterium]